MFAVHVDGDQLDQKLRRTANFPNNIWSFPVLTLLPTRSFKIGLLGLSLLSCFFVVYRWLPESQRAAGNAFRFTAHWDEQNLKPAFLDHPQNLFVKTRCGVTDAGNWSIDNESLTVSFDKRTEVLGWGWNSSDITGQGLQHAAGWSVEVRNSKWTYVQRFGSRCTSWGLTVSADGTTSELVEAKCGAATEQNGALAAYVLLAIGPCAAIYWSSKGHILLAKHALGATFCLFVLSTLTTSYILVSDSCLDTAIDYLELAVPAGAVGLSLLFSHLEPYVGHVCTMAGSIVLLVEAGLVLSGSGFCEFESFQARAGKPLIYFGALLAGAGLWMTTLRRRKQNFAERKQREHCMQLNAAWTCLLADQTTLADLHDLHAISDNWARQSRRQVPEQRFWQESVDSDFQLGSEQLVRSLDQLYAQAAAAQLLLQDKVREVAAESDGELPVTPKKIKPADPDQVFVRWAEAEHSPELRARIQWTQLKKPTRAIEKVLSGLGRCSRLLDICRESIAFESVQGMHKCLLMLCEDETLDVLRVHNALIPGAECATGFRAVKVNLRFQSPAAYSLGVQGHICELLLLLKPFALILNEEQHAAYLDGLAISSKRSLRSLSHILASLNPLRHHSPSFPPPRSPASRSPALRSPALRNGGIPLRDFSSRNATPLGAARLYRSSPLDAGPGPRSRAGSFERESESSSSLLRRTRNAQRLSSFSWSKSFAIRSRSNPKADSTALAWPAELEAGSDEGLVPSTVFLREFRERTLRLGGARLHEWRPTLREGVDQCSAMSVFSTSFPVAAAMRKRVFPWLFLFLALFCALRVLLVLSLLLTPLPDARFLRFSALRLRTPDVVPQAPILEQLGVRRAGCEVPVSLVSVSADWMEYTLVLGQEEPTAIDTVYFKTAGSIATDPVVFWLASSLDAVEWVPVGASRKYVQQTGSTRWANETTSIPEARGTEVQVPLDIVWILSDVDTSMAGVLGCLAMFVFSILGLYEWGPWILVMLFWSIGTMDFTTGVARLVLGHYVLFPPILVRAAAFWLAAYWVGWVSEGHVIEVMLGCGATMTWQALTVVILDGTPEMYFQEPIIVDWALLLTCPPLLYWKRRVHQKAVQNIAGDFERYEQEWAGLCADPRQQEGIRRIADTLSKVCCSGRVRQTYEAWPASQLWGSGWGGEGSSLAGRTRVRQSRRRSSCSTSLSRAASGLARLGSMVSEHEKAAPRNVVALRRSRSAATGYRDLELDGGEGWRGRERVETWMEMLSGWWRGGRERGRAARRRRVETLQLLYRQAAAVHPLVKSKVMRWVAESPTGGMLPGQSQSNRRECLGRDMTLRASVRDVLARGEEQATGGRQSEVGMGVVQRMRDAKGDGALRREEEEVEEGQECCAVRCEPETRVRVLESDACACLAEGNAVASIRSKVEEGSKVEDEQAIARSAERGGSEEVRRRRVASGGSEEGGESESRGRLQQEQPEEKVKWPPLKGLGRASEKLMRSYSADVSRLLDVVRAAVVFDHADELANFLDVIQGDTEVEIVSFKNRLRADFDAIHSGGYRDVHLNLVMQSMEALRLGIAGFVWELQLQLTPIARLRTAGGHARYMRYRNMRAE